jgi:hypothetical protein
MVEYETRELLIPLGVDLYDVPIGPETTRRCQHLIDAALRDARAEGWEPEGPTDWQRLWHSGAITLGDHRGFLGLVGHYSFDAARVRLKRGVSVAPDAARRDLAGVSAR